MFYFKNQNIFSSTKININIFSLLARVDIEHLGHKVDTVSKTSQLNSIVLMLNKKKYFIKNNLLTIF